MKHTQTPIRLALMAMLLIVALRTPQVAARDVPMPAFVGISHWLNTDKPVTPDDLKGKVVLIDFWTYSCINCIRTLPHLSAWYQKYKDKGFEIIGIHSPEFEFEKELGNVKAAVKSLGVTWPVAMDNDHATWNRYATRFWPSHYFVDRKGVIRHQSFGEGHYDKAEKQIQALLAEGGAVMSEAVRPLPTGVDFDRIKTPEIYLGYQRMEHLGNSERVLPDRVQTFAAPKKLDRNRFYLAGQWNIEKESARLVSPTGRIAIRYEANKLNMVMKPSGGVAEVLAEVWIDGKPATAKNKGADVILKDGSAFVKIETSGLYNLTNAEYGEHTLELRFLSPGVAAYTFTFG